ncbi:S8 family serine peptidase [Herbiconiux sp. CPCC 203407]|uniref:S8 family serine peptidase n=1 Tax=Herbiconiux oxytropis TaxID=2970915 RepID=A0AA41XC94_9MICO|nr:S8 family serine peptidase [Herbiconiux oxytropis]MCS5722690.1 S8 family serine peptidase [Herbiconiux oxytropis]MCS5725387.1 S8 family serine peptidase [Herbiconiux oxytropis]
MRSRLLTMPAAIALAGLLLGASAAASGAAATELPAPAGSADPGAAPADPGTAPAVLSPQLEVLAATASAPSSPETAAALAVAAEGAGSLQVDEAERVSVTATFAAAPDAAQLAALAGLGEVAAVSPVLPRVTVWITPADLAALAAVPGVTSIATDLAPSVGASGAVLATAQAGSPSSGASAAAAPDASCRSIPVDVDPVLHSDEARARFGVDGTGVTVGVISDSFDTSAKPVTTAAQDVALGVLPGPGNPCGFTEPVVVLNDAAGGTDEGRAMAQLLHGVAPGARILFSTAEPSVSGFAASIVQLTDAGADVIVDDVNYTTVEPMYQSGELGLAIDYATEHGVLYISAADNYNEYGWVGNPSAGHAIGGWAADAFVPMACPEAVVVAAAPVAVDCHNFGSAAEPDATNGILAENNGRGEFSMVLNWAEPVNGVTARIRPGLVTAAGAFEVLGQQPDSTIPSAAFSGALPAAGLYGVVVVRELTDRAAITPGFKFVFTEDESGTVQGLEHYISGEGVTVGPNIFGHTADENVLSIGAADYRTPTIAEGFSSVGPVKHLFGAVQTDGSPSLPLPEPATRAKPDLTSLDAAQTSFFAAPAGPDGAYRFSGTSAASPNAAGVAALALQHSPQSSADEVKAALKGTTSAMTNPYLNLTAADVHGTGLLDALAALEALPAAPVPAPTPAPAPAPVPAALAATGVETVQAVQLAVTATSVTALGSLALLAGVLGLRRHRRRVSSGI